MKRLRFGAMAFLLPLVACKGRDADLPAPYRSVEVPRSRLASVASRGRGRRLFLEHCALCHGTEADGRGVRREGFSSPPRDFTDPDVRRRVSPRRMFFEIREGVRGTAMPSWKSLSEGETWDLVAYLRSVAPGSR